MATRDARHPISTWLNVYACAFANAQSSTASTTAGTTAAAVEGAKVVAAVAVDLLAVPYTGIAVSVVEPPKRRRAKMLLIHITDEYPR